MFRKIYFDVPAYQCLSYIVISTEDGCVYGYSHTTLQIIPSLSAKTLSDVVFVDNDIWK